MTETSTPSPYRWVTLSVPFVMSFVISGWVFLVLPYSLMYNNFPEG